MLNAMLAIMPTKAAEPTGPVDGNVRLPPWVTGDPFPDWMVPLPGSWLAFEVVTGNKAATLRPRLDFATFLDAEGARCSEAEMRHLALIGVWVIWLLGTEGVEHRPWKPSSLPNAFYALRKASLWMAREGFGRWDTLGSAEIARLKEHLYASGEAGGIVGREGRRYSLLILRALHTMHRRWAWLPDGIGTDPAVGDKAVVRRVLQQARDQDPDYVDGRKRGTRSIPWPVAQALLATAISLVETVDAELVNAIVAEARATRLIARTQGRSQKQSRALVAERLVRFGATRPDAARLMASHGVAGLAEAIDLHRDLVTACYILLAAFGALRISEAADLPADGCLDERVDGPWMNTVIIKTSAEAAGSVIPRIVPPVSRKAVRAALALTAPHRPDGRTELFLSYDHDHDVVSLFSQKVANDRLNQFVKRRMPEHSGWALATHQLRKLFVQLFVRRFEGTIPALQQHVGHISNRMVEAYLDDPEIVRMIRDDRKDLTSEIMAGVMLGGVAASGKAAEAWRAEGMEYQAKNMTVEEVSRLVRKHLDGERMHLEPNGVGYCVSSPASAANGLCGRNALGLPDHANRQEGMCLGCVNHVSTERNESHLKAEFVLHRQMAESPDAAPPLRDASKRRCLLIQARLRDLEETRPGGNQETRS